MASSMLKKASAKKIVRVKEAELTSPGLSKDAVILLGDPESQMYQEMVKAAEKMGLEVHGAVLVPARPKAGVRKALADKKSR